MNDCSNVSHASENSNELTPAKQKKRKKECWKATELSERRA